MNQPLADANVRSMCGDMVPLDGNEFETSLRARKRNNDRNENEKSIRKIGNIKSARAECNDSINVNAIDSFPT